MITQARESLLQAVRLAAVQAMTADELPAFLGDLERLRVEILLAAAQSREALDERPSPKPDRLLSPIEVASRLGRSKWWVYQNKDALPIVRLPTGRYGFSEKGIDRWMERRKSQ